MSEPGRQRPSAGTHASSAPVISERLALARALAAEGHASAQQWWPGNPAASRALEARGKRNALDLVTAADQAIEAQWRARLAEAFPDDAIVGEEQGGAARGSSGWWLDPVDGTVNFSRGWPLWACALATADEHERIGAISLGTGEHVWGSTASGAWVDRGAGAVATRASSCSSMEQAVVLSFIGWDHASGDRQPTRYDRLSRAARHIQQIWSSSTVFAHVATGQADAAVLMVSETDRASTPWDFLPGTYLCASAGAVIVEGEHAICAAGPDLIDAVADAAGL